MPTLDQELRDAIVKVIPELVKAEVTGVYPGYEEYSFYMVRPINLADVMRSIDAQGLEHAIAVDQSGWFWILNDGQAPKPTGILFDLTKNLEDQSEECKAFLHSIICSK